MKLQLDKSFISAMNLVESSPDMIIAVDNDRKIIEFNAAAELIFGYQRKEIIGEHINKEIPIGDKFKSSWDEEMSLTRYLDDCNEGDEFEYKVMTELPLFYCNDFAPYIENDCLSAVLIRHYSESRVRLYGMTVYGLYNLDGKLTILPLRNLK